MGVVVTEERIVVVNGGQDSVVVRDTSPRVVVNDIVVGQSILPIETPVTVQDPDTVIVQGVGIQGPKGEKGDDGSGIEPEIYTLTAVSSWYHAHTFPYPPEVRLVDQTGEECEIGVEYADDTHVSITFPVPFTGTLILS